MATLNNSANRVLGEFGQRIPAEILTFEDARREFLSVRSLALQRLGISDTDKLLTDRIVTGGQRTGMLPAFEDHIPSFVEYERSNPTTINPAPEKVEIVPLDKIPSYEGGRTIAFYDNQRRYRTSWDHWKNGTMRIWYAPMEDLAQVRGADDADFMTAFTTFLVKQTAMNLTSIIRMNLALQADSEQDLQRLTLIGDALSALQITLLPQVEEWKRAFKQYVNKDLNTQPHLRRTQGETTTFDNVTGTFAGDFSE
jgi:hypothetical protein